jgi:hypothetical protein
MKKTVTTIIAALGLFLTIAAASVSAQTPTGAEVNIPFDFSAGKASLKAGTYVIIRKSDSTLQIRHANEKKTILVNAPLTIGSRDYRAGERLVFNRYGDEYFLTQVWFTADQGKQLLPSNAETSAARGLAKRNLKAERVEIAVRRS